MITKKICTRQESYIQFTEEEMEQLQIKAGDKFTWEVLDEGLMLKKHISMEIDFSEFDKETLIFLIAESCEKDISINDVISQVLEKAIENPKLLSSLTRKNKHVKR